VGGLGTRGDGALYTEQDLDQKTLAGFGLGCEETGASAREHETRFPFPVERRGGAPGPNPETTCLPKNIGLDRDAVIEIRPQFHAKPQVAVAGIRPARTSWIGVAAISLQTGIQTETEVSFADVLNYTVFFFGHTATGFFFAGEKEFH
jgi:hypothetical protein